MLCKSHYIFTGKEQKTHDTAQSQQIYLIVIISVKGASTLGSAKKQFIQLEPILIPLGIMDGMQHCMCCNVIRVTLATKYLSFSIKCSALQGEKLCGFNSDLKH